MGVTAGEYADAQAVDAESWAWRSRSTRDLQYHRRVTMHSYAAIEHPLARLAVVSHRHARRLAVFVHGWNGSGSSTWGEFDRPPTGDDWWAETDLLFVDYASVSEAVTATADRLRRHFADFYPMPHRDMLTIGEVAVRASPKHPYEELVLVGHSLGGLVIRRALVDAMDEWRFGGFRPEERPGILDGHQRLFSPASAGVRIRGRLSWMMTMFPILDEFLSGTGSYPDLKPTSLTIKETQERTQSYGLGDPRTRCLAARILWANPEDVVIPERYRFDESTQTMDGVDHRSICKPSGSFLAPYKFVRSGSIA